MTGAAATDSLFRLVLANAGSGECAFSVLWQQAESVLRLTADSFSWDKGLPKNLVSVRTGIGQVTVTLGTVDVLPGTIVRVFRIQPSNVATKNVRVTASGTNYDLSTNRMAEFLFDGSAGAWLCLQFNVAVK